MATLKMLLLITALLVVASFERDAAADATLVKDIYTAKGLTPSVRAEGFVRIGGIVYFAATGRSNGRELWKTDGTPEGTQSVRDINLGQQGSDPEDLVAAGTTLFFTADDGVHGRKLWKSDGTHAGTSLVGDLATLHPDASPSELTEFSGKLYFVFRSSIFQLSIWSTDGTDAGTSIAVSHINNPTLINGGDRLFVIEKHYVSGPFGEDYFYRNDLYRSDGTDSGTQLLASELPPINSTVVIDGTLYFLAGFESYSHIAASTLWKSDGTAAGTQMIESEFSGISEPEAGQLTRFGNDLLFFVGGDNSRIRSLWSSDGTPNSAHKIADNAVHGLAVANGFALFGASDPLTGREPWVTDGTVAGTRLLSDIRSGTAHAYPAQFIAVGDLIVFSTKPNLGGLTTWVSDGTPSGTTQLLGSYSVRDAIFTLVEDLLYFRLGSRELWVTDGTTDGTRMITDFAIGSSSSIGASIEFEGNLYFGATSDPEFALRDSVGLWRTDGTTTGTTRVKEMSARFRLPLVRDFRIFDEKLYFLGEETNSELEIYTTDGSEAGTYPVTDLGAQQSGGLRDAPVSLNGDLIFPGFASGQGGVWRSDGTQAGTERLKEFASFFSNYSRFDVINGFALFYADDGSGVGRELWRTDGTTAGTQLVRDIYPGSRSSEIESGVVFGNTYCFSATSPATGNEIWCSRGNDEDTNVLIETRSGPRSSHPDSLTVLGDLLFFRGYSSHGGKQLFVYDVVLHAVTPLLDWPGNGMVELTPVGDRVFFAYDDGIHGGELWVSNGTDDGTLLVRDLEPGPTAASPTNLQAVAGRLTFSACTAETGCELWVSDGTKSGTRRLTDVAPGPESSHPRAHGVTGDRLMFSAYTTQLGDELYMLDLGVCGDGQLDALEECDDGNIESGDGCSASCDVDSTLNLVGSASGGSVSVTIEGVTVAIDTLPGQTTEDIAAVLASKLALHNALRARGVSTWARGGSIITDGELTTFDSQDPGVGAISPLVIPALGSVAHALLLAALLVTAVREIRRNSSQGEAKYET